MHLAVVDPGVGGDRRAVAVRTADGRMFVGPDNGLLMLAADELGVVEARTSSRTSAYRLPDVSRTFHARDVFAPAAAHLAAGVPIAELGPALDPATLVRIDVPDPEVGRTQISATVLSVDRFGNVATNVRREHIDALGLANGDRVEVRIALDRYYAFVAEHVRRRRSRRADPLRGLVRARHAGDQPRRRGAPDGRRPADDELRIARRMTAGQRFARLVTIVVVRAPVSLARLPASADARASTGSPRSGTRRGSSRERLAPMVAALESLPDAPARALDVGTGTGAVARLRPSAGRDAEVDRRRRLGRHGRRGAARASAASATRSPTRRRSRSRTGASTS